jgi:hypothetical protein
MSGGWSRSDGLQTGQGMPAPPHWQASARSEKKPHGRSGCASQVSSQTGHLPFADISIQGRLSWRLRSFKDFLGRRLDPEVRGACGASRTCGACWTCWTGCADRVYRASHARIAFVTLLPFAPAGPGGPAGPSKHPPSASAATIATIVGIFFHAHSLHRRVQQVWRFTSSDIIRPMNEFVDRGLG